jgi:hypothetical protein
VGRSDHDTEWWLKKERPGGQGPQRTATYACTESVITSRRRESALRCSMNGQITLVVYIEARRT